VDIFHVLEKILHPCLDLLKTFKGKYKEYLNLKYAMLLIILFFVERCLLWPRWSSGLCTRLPSEGCGFEYHRRLCLVTCCDAGTIPLGRLSPYSLGDLAKDREGYCQNDKGCSPTRVRALEKRP